MDQKTVFVGMSGGVDSSVAALRLKNQGYRVVGVFIRVWHPEFLKCNWEAERVDAMRVAAHLDIPFMTCDARTAYKNDVADYFIKEYQEGRTPNPDVMCNKHVKFGAFLDFARSKGADFIATGHYAQKQTDRDGATLLRGIDTGKDQSYFLWTLTPQQLRYTLLPIGDTAKDQIRLEAAQAKLPTAEKKDSQGICFLGHVDIKDFLSHYIELVPGNVLLQDGTVVGRHDGALIYTIGQRQGYTVNTDSATRAGYYVHSRDLKANTITVAPDKPSTKNGQVITLRDMLLRRNVAAGDMLHAQFRYRQTPFWVTIMEVTEDGLTLSINESSEAAEKGQSCVLYEGVECVGGGIIS